MAKTYDIKLDTELFYCGPNYQPRVTIIDDYFGCIHAKIRIEQDIHNTNQIIGYLPEPVIPKYNQIIFVNYQYTPIFDTKSYPIALNCEDGNFKFDHPVPYKKGHFIHMICVNYRLN